MRKTLALGSVLLATFIAAAAQAETFPLQHGHRTPAATGTIEFNKGEQGNNKVSIEAKYLAIPKDLGQNYSTYVVWLDPGQGRNPTPIGTLRPDKNRNAKLEVATPFKSFRVLVTAESSSTPSGPSDLVILQGQVQPKPEE